MHDPRDMILELIHANYRELMLSMCNMAQASSRADRSLMRCRVENVAVNLINALADLDDVDTFRSELAARAEAAEPSMD